MKLAGLLDVGVIQSLIRNGGGRSSSLIEVRHRKAALKFVGGVQAGHRRQYVGSSRL